MGGSDSAESLSACRLFRRFLNMATPTAIVATLALFATAGFLFLFVNLLIGKLLRPSDPHAEKLEVYECGEPTIGSSFVQFDLRFYVVALVFIVFDVEVAFLFPLSTVYGKAAQMASPDFAPVVETETGTAALSDDAAIVYRELGVANASIPASDDVAEATAAFRADAKQLAWATFWAINVFFFILLVGFAYEWKTGAFDWVRAVSRERAAEVPRAPPGGETVERETVLMM